MPSSLLRPRVAVLAIVAVAIVVAAVVVVRHFAAIHDVKGTITYLDIAQRVASVEVIDPANGRTREFRGTAADDCVVTINGQPAQLTDLRVGDTAQMRVRVERKSLDSPEARILTATQPTTQGAGAAKANPSRHKTKKVLTAERIEVTRR